MKNLDDNVHRGKRIKRLMWPCGTRPRLEQCDLSGVYEDWPVFYTDHNLVMRTSTTYIDEFYYYKHMKIFYLVMNINLYCLR